MVSLKICDVNCTSSVVLRHPPKYCADLRAALLAIAAHVALRPAWQYDLGHTEWRVSFLDTYPCRSTLQRAAAEGVLKALQANPDAWQKVDSILETSTNQQTKFFALQASAT